MRLTCLPSLGTLAWLGLAVFAFGIRRVEGRLWGALAIFAGVWTSVFLSQIWLCLTISHFMAPLVPMERAPLWLSALAWAFAAAITASHRSLPVILAALLLRAAPLPRRESAGLERCASRPPPRSGGGRALRSLRRRGRPWLDGDVPA